jgi:hypothetical protein
VLLDTLAYHVTRHFPAWAGWLPAHSPRIQPLAQPAPPPPAPEPARALEQDRMPEEGMAEAGR